MPGHAVHIELARACWSAATEAGGASLSDDPVTINALYHGAVGPDMGYFPGADVLLTDLAHYHLAGDLARNLLSLASTDVQRAYAWGWLTHFVGDTLVHPLVNRACGERIHGDRDQPATYADSQVMHLRVEFGLDTVRMVAAPEVQGVRLRPAFDENAIGFLREAYRRTYELDFGPGPFLKAHQAVTRWQGPLFRLGGMVGRRHVGHRLEAADLLIAAPFYPLRWLSSLAARDSIVFGVTHTLAPAAWFANDVDAVMRGVPPRFIQLLADGLAGLPNLNLDTGGPAAEPYGPAQRAIRALGERRRDG